MPHRSWVGIRLAMCGLMSRGVRGIPEIRLIQKINLSPIFTRNIYADL